MVLSNKKLRDSLMERYSSWLEVCDWLAKHEDSPESERTRMMRTAVLKANEFRSCVDFAADLFGMDANRLYRSIELAYINE